MIRSLNSLSKPSRKVAPNMKILGKFFAIKLSLSNSFDVGLPTLAHKFMMLKLRVHRELS